MKVDIIIEYRGQKIKITGIEFVDYVGYEDIFNDFASDYDFKVVHAGIDEEIGQE